MVHRSKHTSDIACPSRGLSLSFGWLVSIASADETARLSPQLSVKGLIVRL